MKANWPSHPQIIPFIIVLGLHDKRITNYNMSYYLGEISAICLANQSPKQNTQAGHLGPKRCFCLLDGFRPQAPTNRRLDPAAARFCKTLWPLPSIFTPPIFLFILFIQVQHQIQIGLRRQGFSHLVPGFMVCAIEPFVFLDQLVIFGG